MITLSFNSDKGTRNANRGAHEQQVRDIVDSHLAFPGAEKLAMGVTIKNNGATSVSFTGPEDLVAEAKRLWREKIKPAAAKLKREAAKVKRATTRATSKVKSKLVKKAATKKAAPKPATAKKVAKRVVAGAKAKASRGPSKKRKS